MTKLYQKSELGFAILWIALYVGLNGLGEGLSARIGVVKAASVPIHAALSLILLLWLRKNRLCEQYGLCRPRVPARRFLYYLPLAAAASAALWGGAGLSYGFPGTLLFVVSMCCVGFLEELLFRGLLFRALERCGVKMAIVVSALSFGLGHIGNLLHGGQSPIEALVQLLFAVLTGFVLALIFWRGGSLLPCVLFHAVNNALFAFAAEAGLEPGLQTAIHAGVLLPLLGGYLFYLVKLFPGPGTDLQ